MVILTSIVPGMITNATWGKYFIDNLFYNSHNYVIEEGTIITSCNQLSVSVKIGKHIYFI